MRPATSSRPHVRGLSPNVRLLVLVALFLLVVLVPARAYAWFNDVTDSYPASQDVNVSGSPLTGADIPEGTYPINVSCSSYMCKFTNATVTSVGGELYVTFTLSKAYNALFLGTAEEAAANTNEDGTDVSAYYVSEPLEGYVARQFTLPISALNQKITLATYSGGSKGNKEGMWYTRTVAFNSSSAIEEAMAGGKEDPGKEEQPSDTGQQEGQSGGGNTEQKTTDVTDTSNPQTTTDTTDTTSSDTTTSSKSKNKSSSSNTSSSTTSTTTSTSTPSSSNTGTTSTPTTGSTANASASNSNSKKDKNSENAEQDAAADSATQTPASVPAGNVKMGRGISIVSVDDIPLANLPDQGRDTSQSNDKDAARMGTIAAIVVVCVLNLVLAGTFVIGLRRARPDMFRAFDRAHDEEGMI